MPTIRRLYVYALSAIALTVLGIGLVILLTVAFHALGLEPTSSAGFRDPQEDRRQLSLAAAMIGVGLPVWLLHWWLAERGRRRDSAAWEPERASVVRALYLTGVLAVTLIAGVASSMELVRVAGWRVSGVPLQDQLYADPGGALATLLVVGVAWVYHASVRRRDLAAGPLSGASSFLTRAYRYAAALIGLVIGLQGLVDLLRLAGDLIVAPPGPAGAPEGADLASRLAGGTASLVAGLAVWGGHAWYSSRLASDPGWRGSAERRSRLRTAYVTAVIAGGAVGTLSYLVEAAGAPILLWTRAHDLYTPPIDGAQALRTAAVAILAAVPWFVAWRLHRAWLLREARDDGASDGQAGRTAEAARLNDHTVALAGLAFVAAGSAWLLGLLIDVALGGTRTSVDLPWKSDLATYLPAALLGGALFAAAWSSIRRRERAELLAEVASPIRRAALLLAVAASVVALLVSASLILYRLFSSVFGVQEPGSTVSILSAPLGALVVAILVLVAAATLLRRDVRRVPARAAPGLAVLAPGRGAAPVAGAPAAPAAPPSATAPTTAAMPALVASTRDLLLEAVDAAAPLLGSAELRAGWNGQSALAEWTVAGVAGHLARSARAVLDYLDAPAPAPDALPVPAAAYYDAVLPPVFDPDDRVHVGIRARGEEAASAGPDAVAAWFAETRAALAARLPAEPPDRLLRVGGGVVMRLDDYLLTRLVEVTVHTDDLAVSIGVPTPAFPPVVSDAVLGYLTTVARERHGDLAVLRAFTRRERDTRQALRVF
jgi:uncharacterized protein (TIGR03083 family)